MAAIFDGEVVCDAHLLAIYGDTAAALKQATQWAVPGHPITVVVPDVMPDWQTKITVLKEKIT